MSALHTRRAAVVSGDGLVGRSQHGLLVVHGHPDAIDALLVDRPLDTSRGIDALRRTAEEGLPDGVAGLLVAVQSDDGIEVTTAGPEHVSVDGVEPLAERRGQATVHRIHGDGDLRLGVAFGRIGAAHDLREGVVPGAGVALVASHVRSDSEVIAADVAAASAVASEPVEPLTADSDTVPAAAAARSDAEAAPASAATDESVPTLQEASEVSSPAPQEAAEHDAPAGETPSVEPVPPIPAPPPQATRPASFATSGGAPAGGQRRGPVPTVASQPQSDAAELVEGILCSRHHFNNPVARFCQVCGISMVHLTHNLVERPRPTLGFIVFDDGTTFALDRSYLIGREPLDSGDTRLTPLVVDDDDHSVSRAHAELRLIEWQVVLRDLGSSNGTHLWDPQSSSWRRLPAGSQVALEAGTYAAVGRRVFVFEPAVRS